MKKFFLFLGIVALFAACQKTDPIVELGMENQLKSAEVTGNGAPSGPHYTLNLIGVDNPKTASMDNSSGHTIFVPLSGDTKIELMEGESFAVLDGNATDGPAQFQLPNPELDPYFINDPITSEIDVMSAYSVYVRPLGKPGGVASITTCADVVESSLWDFLSKKFQNIVKTAISNDPGGFGGYASLENVAVALPLESKGKPRFENVTAELLTIVLEVTITYDDDNDPTTDNVSATELIRVPIFDPILENEYWWVQNDGMKLIQLRFYPGIQTDVTYADGKF